MDKKSLIENFDVLGQLGIQRASVTWYNNAVKVGRRVLALGYCSYGRGVAFIACYSPNKPITSEFLKVFMIRDVLYGKWNGVVGCDDAKWCLNLDCKYNRAQLKYFTKYGVKNRESLERLHKLLKDCSEKLELTSKGSVVISYEKPPLRLRRV